MASPSTYTAGSLCIQRSVVSGGLLPSGQFAGGTADGMLLAMGLERTTPDRFAIRYGQGILCHGTSRAPSAIDDPIPMASGNCFVGEHGFG